MLRRLALVLALAFALPGCAALASILPTVIATVTEAAAWLDTIESAADAYFAANPDKAEARKTYEKAMARTRVALSAAMRASKGAEKLDQQKVDEAFAEFQKLYQDLLALLGPLGVCSVSPDGSVGVSPAGGPLMVPPAADLVPKVE